MFLFFFPSEIHLPRQKKKLLDKLLVTDRSKINPTFMCACSSNFCLDEKEEFRENVGEILLFLEKNAPEIVTECKISRTLLLTWIGSKKLIADVMTMMNC